MCFLPYSVLNTLAIVLFFNTQEELYTTAPRCLDIDLTLARKDLFAAAASYMVAALLLQDCSTSIIWEPVKATAIHFANGLTDAYSADAMSTH